MPGCPVLRLRLWLGLARIAGLSVSLFLDAGATGKEGAPGKDGKDGKDGKGGADGLNGLPGTLLSSPLACLAMRHIQFHSTVRRLQNGARTAHWVGLPQPARALPS